MLLSIFFLASAYAAHLPSNFHNCKTSDNECLRTAIDQAIKLLSVGDKSLGIVPLDPLAVPIMSVEGDPGSVNLNQKYTNIRAFGLTQGKINKVDVQLDKCEIYLEAFNPYVRIQSDYELKGHILLFTIDSKGYNNITLTNLKSTHKMNCEKLKKNGETYIHIKSYEFVMLPQSVKYDYHELDSPFPEITQQVQNVLNENDLTVFNDTKPAYEESYGLIFKDMANKLFTKVPLNQIFLS